MIGIIDYSLGNIQNIKNALEKLEYEYILSSKYEDLKDCDAILLPGVGHFGNAMETIDRLDIKWDLLKLAETKRFIGICLGMQLLFEESAEGDAKGLGLLPGRIIRMKTPHPVPHLGWNTLTSTNPVLDGKDVYFVHSFMAESTEHAIATAEYGVTVPAVVKKGNIIGIQFHPEKSGDLGVDMLKQAIEGGL
ncbi:imidazole glycerol phosphate synthase subunit HisH [Salinicoccus hispanicus]|uniref:Imidazole glycerol phosphate synthase subunit HisH n=1 Tax=Salinicoccus hispanicus TaxID=157225 RepID=A0A6N8U2E1_9STAP|nr:imidazole glycerol phosphate synthase subunit HisH [Salinicoccus hispanicus]MXQ51507.1 imidazole glycerol phosphate synthase subunit HisH [Salinicoccus hispanicus]